MPLLERISISQQDMANIIASVKGVGYTGDLIIIDTGLYWTIRDIDNQFLTEVEKYVHEPADGS